MNRIEADYTTHAPENTQGLKATVAHMLELWLDHWQRVLTFAR